MRYTQLIILCLLCQHIFCQTQLNFVVLSSETKQPIEGVSIVYSKSNEGTFSNADGKAALARIDTGSIVVTHIGYDTLYVSKQDITNQDTILLTLNTRSILIAEITIPPYDLHKSLNYVLDNFEKLYVSKPYEKIGNFKETARIDGILKRLVLTKMSWWSDGYVLDRRRQPKLRLFDVEYNQEVPFDIFIDIPEYNARNTGHADIRRIIPIMYLNAYLRQLIDYSPSLSPTNIYSDSNITKVEYESNWSTIHDQTTRSVGYFLFDNETKAIIEFSNSIEEKMGKKEIKINLTDVSFTKENKKSLTKHTFFQNEDGKYSLKSLNIYNETEVTYKDKTFEMAIDNCFFLLKETIKRTPGKGNFVDPNIPLHKNIPETAEIISPTNSILLSADEKKFIENAK